MKSVANIARLASVKSRSSQDVTAHDRSQTVSQGFTAAVLANLIWGTSFLASKYTLASWGPLTASAIRFVIATIAILAFSLVAKKSIKIPHTWLALGRLVLLALVGFGLLYPLQLAGLKQISSGLSSAIMLLSPLLVLLFGKFLSGETFSRNKLVAVSLGIFGGSILCFSMPGGTSHTSNYLVGIGLTLLAAAALALSAILTRKLSNEFDSLSITFWSMLFGAMMLVTGTLLVDGDSAIAGLFHASTQSWIAVLFLGIICSATCFFLWNFALAKAPASEIASTMHIKTPTAVLLGALLAHESITIALLSGAVIVAVAVYISQQPQKGAGK